MPKQLLTDVLIDAPPELVWSVFTNYPEWKSFNSVLVSEHAPGSLEVGDFLEATLTPPGQAAQAVKAQVMSFERNKSMRTRFKPVLGLGVLVTSEHFFSVRAEPGGKTLFIQGLDASGFMVPFIGGLLKSMEQGFIEFNNGLKKTVEAKATAAKAPPVTAPAPAQE